MAPAPTAGATLLTDNHPRHMKELLSFILTCVMSTLLLGQEPRHAYVTMSAQVGKEFHRATQAQIVSTLTSHLTNDVLAPNDLDTLLSQVHNTIATFKETNLAAALTKAEQQVKDVNARLVAVLIDPDNKSMALGLEPEQWLRQIQQCKSDNTTLEWELGRLKNTIIEMRDWAALIAPVAPPDQLTHALQGRLRQILTEWKQRRNQSRETSSDARAVPRATDTVPRERATQHRDTMIMPRDSQTLTLSAQVRDVVRLVQAGIGEAVILSFINSCNKRYDLTEDITTRLRDGGVPMSLITAMLRHDAAFTEPAGEPARAHTGPTRQGKTPIMQAQRGRPLAANTSGRP